MSKKLKTRNSGQWTEARFRSFVMSQLRSGRWPVKYEVLKESYAGDGVNPDTGRKCKLYKCGICGGMFPQKKMQVDHIKPIIPLTGFDDWGSVISRLYCESDNLMAVCKGCHSIKTKEEQQIRRKNKQ